MKERNNPTWNKLDSLYRDNEYNMRLTAKPKVQMIFFKEENDKELDYFNSAKIYLEDDELIIKPTINHIFLKTIKVPWEDLKPVEKRILFLKSRDIFKVKDTDLYIGI